MKLEAHIRLQASMVTLRVHNAKATKGTLEFSGDNVEVVDEAGRTALTLIGGASALKGYKKVLKLEVAKGVKTAPYAGVQVKRVTKGTSVNTFDVVAPMGNIQLARIQVSK